MKRIKHLNRYQLFVLLLMAAMCLAFAVIYPVTLSRVGFSYQNAIFVPKQENGGTVYSGRLSFKKASFTVSADQTVLFQYGDTCYGPYTAKEDPTAIPADAELAARMTGVELCNGNELLFRGGVIKDAYGQYWLYAEDGTSNALSITYVTSDGLTHDANGNLIDPVAPTAETILSLLDEPVLTHNGNWWGWFLGAFLCLFTAITLLFADGLFRWHMSLRVYNAQDVEPSGLELAGRYVGWTLLAILSLVIFILGLQ